MLQCTLRLLCETAMTPSSPDLLGEAARLLLVPTHLLHSIQAQTHTG